MEKFIILPDVTFDLDNDIQKEIGIEDYIQGHVNFDDGRDYRTKTEWTDISREEFYKTISNKKRKVTSAPASPEEYAEVFEKYVKDGYKIISTSLTSAISASLDFAKKGAEIVRAKYPDCNIYCMDSFRMTGGHGLLVLKAARMKQEGKSFDEIIAWMEENKYRIHQMGPIDDLTFVARRGTISKGKAIMGNFAGVKPCGDCNEVGYTTVLTNIKGLKKAMEATVEYVRRTAVDIENEEIVISHTNRQEKAEELAKMIEDALHPKKIFISDVFPSCGVNIGPGMIAAYYFGNKVSEGVEAEKAIMAEITAKK